MIRKFSLPSADLTGYPAFDIVLSYLFPDRQLAEVKEMLLKLDSVEAFQAEFMYHAVYSIIKKTSNGLTVSGQENLRPGEPYLFISNHRDIVLDAAILQVLLLDNSHKTSQITFGSNLMTSPAGGRFRQTQPDVYLLPGRFTDTDV